MSLDQGLLSPPSSGRNCKTHQPRVDGNKTVNSIFAPADPAGLHRQHQHPQQHINLSPIKQHPSALSSTRPPTPPLSCDARHGDDHGASLLLAAPCPSFSDGDIEENIVRLSHGSNRHGIPYSEVSSRQTQSDDEVDLLLEPACGSSSSSALHLLSPSAPDVDSDQDSWSADHDDTLESDDDERLAPRTPLSLDGSRPRVWDAPIRDTPKNPFLAGGPADQGFHGPRGREARQRARQLPQKERGKITYVFRGQRVTYADPEYDSDDSEDWANGELQGTRPPRLQPKLLFPPASLPAAMPAPKPAGGLFASQLAQKRKLAESSQPSAPEAAMQRVMPHQPDQSARRALLARLEQTDWSDDEEQDNDSYQHKRQHHDNSDESDEDEQVEPVRPVKRLRQSLSNGEPHDQDEREVAFWLQDASQQRHTVAKTNLVQRMKGR